MIHLALRTGYTFKHVYGHIDKVISFAGDQKVIGIADVANTFAHAGLEQKCKEAGIKSIFGVRINVVNNGALKVAPRGQFGPEYIFLAKNSEGLKEIYKLLKISFDNFYYRGQVSWHDIDKLTDNVIVIAENLQTLDHRIDYIALTTTTPRMMLELDIPKVAITNNYYCDATDKDVYEVLSAPRNTSNQTYPQFIMNERQFRAHFKDVPCLDEAIKNTYVIAEMCNAVLNKAPMIKFNGVQNDIEYLCKLGAKAKGLNITEGLYAERYRMEIELIRERNFEDYFLVVADMIKKAKKKMLVGPSRGSSAGSLVCYLLSITEIDPIKYDLLFERFIDVNRKDLPDIDIDFPDDKRDSVIKQLIKDYGADKVKHIATISRLKAKSAIGEFAKSLRVPIHDTEELKNSIIERSGGDARAAMCIQDTFETIEIGKDFIKKYPSMMSVAKVENHPRHSGVHAAGIIVCNDPIENYAGVSTRDDTVMVDRFEAEYLNLLKIDVLGLRTLTILSECAAMVGMSHHEFYTLHLDDQKTFQIFNDMRLSGIFQFEGYSLALLTRRMGIQNFDDIVAITALARPGALYSGGAARYVEYRLGQKDPVYIGELHKKVTETTFGIVVFQEQILRICREIGKMSWTDVNKLRKALSKSLGEEFFSKYKEKFMAGSAENGYSAADAETIWGELCYGGNYAFNKSHAVAYGLVSYWTAYMKAHHPLEFTVANLNNAKDNESALKILRDAVTVEKLKYLPIDPDVSTDRWSINGDTIVGPLTNVDGIGPMNAKKIMSCRAYKVPLPTGLILRLINPKTFFDILYPTRHYWGKLIDNPSKYGLQGKIVTMETILGEGEYMFIGKLIGKNVRDLNEYVNVTKRGGKLIEGAHLELTIKLEDDTDTLMCSVNRYIYEDIGREIAEHAVIDQDWFLVRGKIKGEKSRYIQIQHIFKLSQELFNED